MKYEQIRDQLKTGDIILFSGNSGVSKFIRFFSASRWSHVGMVVRIDDWDAILLWESTSLSGVKDAMDKIPKKGVQTVYLSQRVETYNGDLALRPLNKPITDTMKQALVSLRKKLKNRPYEKSKVELAKSLIDMGFLSENEEDLSSVFCSELVAEALQEMNVIPQTTPSNEYTPKDFEEYGKIDKDCLSSYNYGPLIDIG